MSLSIMLAPNYGLEFLYLPFSLSQQKMPELKRLWGGGGVLSMGNLVTEESVHWV